MKTVAVIGHLVRDMIINPEGEHVSAFGGVAYNLTALGVLARQSFKVIPVFNIGFDFYDDVKNFYGKFPAVDFSCVKQISRKNKIHKLKYFNNGSREEVNIGEMPLIAPRLFSKCRKLDLALINYIGGDEFPPRFIRWLKKEYTPVIYLDYHSLSLGKINIDKSRYRVKRYLRYNPHWREYISLADVVQMNFDELKSIFKDAENDNESIVNHALKIFSCGPGTVVITRGEKGVIVISGAGSAPKIDILPALPVKKVVDPTGCGDCFAAGFISSYIIDENIARACGIGLKLAGYKVGFSGLNGLLDFSKVLK